jgi:DNA polymerase III epsilon subunit-like protein
MLNILCLDAEFADNEELLELSVFNLEGREVYHSYYRPEQISDWRTDIHHITPEMVRNERTFASCRGEVQKLLDEAFALTGFAVGNDLRVLTRSGVVGLDEKRVIDVKDMYWYLKGRQAEMNPFSVPSLLVCANALGLDFGEDEAHSASADTEATLKSFNILFEEFCNGTEGGESSESSVDRFVAAIEEAKALFVEENARGYVKVLKSGPYHKLKYGKFKEQNTQDLVVEIEVADRYKAEYEIKKMLKKKEVPDKFNLYKLTAKLLDDIRNYTNEYDAEESAWCKKVIRNLGRLSL